MAPAVLKRFKFVCPTYFRNVGTLSRLMRDIDLWHTTHCAIKSKEERKPLIERLLHLFLHFIQLQPPPNTHKTIQKNLISIFHEQHFEKQNKTRVQ